MVVIGHIADKDTLHVEEWYLYLKTIIYQFHMPLFMFLSGFIFFYTYSNINNLKEYTQYAIKKSNRILPPFIIFSVIIFFGKLVSSHFLYVENISLDNLIFTYLQLYIQPTESFIGSYWYIYVLLEYLLIFPLLLKFSNNKLLPWIIIGAIIFFIPASSLFGMNMFVRNFLFFALGIFVMQNYEKYTNFLKNNFFILFSLFILSFSLMIILPLDISRFFIGLLSIPALHSFINSSFLNKSNLLIILGRYSFIIYLTNTIFIGLTKTILFKLNTPFTIVFILSVLFGSILPIVLKKYILNKTKYLNDITN